LDVKLKERLEEELWGKRGRPAKERRFRIHFVPPKPSTRPVTSSDREIVEGPTNIMCPC
jgi:hypothetical protein